MTNYWYTKKKKMFHLLASKFGTLLLKSSCFLLVFCTGGKTMWRKFWKILKAFCYVVSWISYSDYNFQSQHKENGIIKIKASHSRSSRLLYKLRATDKCTTFNLIKIHLPEMRRLCHQQHQIIINLETEDRSNTLECSKGPKEIWDLLVHFLWSFERKKNAKHNSLQDRSFSSIL